MARELYYDAELEKFAFGGQTICNVKTQDEKIKKAFIWGGLPTEKVKFLVTKKRAGIYEGIVTEVYQNSKFRVDPKDINSYLSTSPWQILDFEYENSIKAELTKLAFSQNHIDISVPEVISDGNEYFYRNKMEFTFWWDNENERISLAHYRRGTKGKIAVKKSSLAKSAISDAASRICDLLNIKKLQARDLKTILLRSTRQDEVVAQIYVVNESVELNQEEFNSLGIKGLEIIFSNPKSPASVITRRLQTFGDVSLSDKLLGVKFNYPAESFFQINLPVYEMVLNEIKSNLNNNPIVDLYSGVGSIGLSVADGRDLKLVEINEPAVEEMKNNIKNLGLENAQAILSPAENALDYINSDSQLIIDPPRAGMHKDVIDKILEVEPAKIIYLSCNPATQARDIELLSTKYKINSVKVYNFFPKTPHIESLVVLEKYI